MKPLVSVVVTAYNQPEALAELLASLAAQSFRDFEVVIVNDAGCSVRHVTARFPELAIDLVERRVNQGQTACLNEGVARAGGTYVMTCDQDDMLSPCHLARLVLAIADADLAFADAEVFRYQVVNGRRVPTQSRVLAHRFDAAMLRRYLTFTPSGMLYRRSLHAELGGFDPELSWCYWDWDWVLRVSRSHRIKRVPVASVCYAFGEQNGSARHEAMRPLLDYFRAKHGLGELITTNFALMLDDEHLAGVRAESLRVWDLQPIFRTDLVR